MKLVSSTVNRRWLTGMLAICMVAIVGMLAAITWISAVANTTPPPEPKLLKEIRPGAEGSDVYHLTRLKDKMYFTAHEADNDINLYVSDGTADGTKKFMDFPSDSYRAGLTNLDDKFLFFRVSTYNTETLSSAYHLWRTDGTLSGTLQLSDVQISCEWTNCQDMVAFKGHLFFAGSNPEHGAEIWWSDGTPDGTQMFTEVLSSTNMLVDSVYGLLPVGDQLFMVLKDDIYGIELWVTDGTPGGTHLVKDLNPEGDSWTDFIGLPYLMQFGDKVLFTTYEGNRRLWISDGTEEGTYPVLNTYLDTNACYKSYVNFKGSVYVFLDDGVNSCELWKTDGTASGTEMMVNPQPGQAGTGAVKAIFHNELYFSLESNENSHQLWKTNGSSKATYVLDTNTSEMYGAGPIFSANGYLYMIRTIDLETNLWFSDGTLTGTQILSPVRINHVPGNLAENQVINGQLLFQGGEVQGFEMVDLELWSLEVDTSHITAIDDSVTSLEDETVEIRPLDNDDTLSEDLQIISLGLPAHGQVVTLTAETVIYTPTLNYTGEDVFTYTVKSGANTSTAAVHVTIEPVNDAPVLSPIADQEIEAGQGIDGLSFTVSDVDSPVSAITLTVTSANTTTFPVEGIVLTGDSEQRTISITPAEGKLGSGTITLTATDGAATSTETFTVTVRMAGTKVHLPVLQVK